MFCLRLSNMRAVREESLDQTGGGGWAAGQPTPPTVM